MEIARTFDGWEAKIRAHGIGRFFGAAFLGFWLCGWAAGELFALGALATGGWALVSRNPLPRGLENMNTGGMLLLGGFLLVWLAFWTWGGLAAGWAFLRMIWGEDRIVVRSDLLRITRRAAFVGRTREIPRTEIRRIYSKPGRRIARELMVETLRGPVEITSFATADEQSRLEAELERELRLSPVEAACLPEGWEEIAVPEGGTALVEAPAKRRRNALLVFALAAVAVLLGTVSAWSQQLVPALVMLALAGGAAWAGLRLYFGRHEWRWAGGRVRLDWRTPRGVRTVFAGESMELAVTSDSDNDDWYELSVCAASTGGTDFRHRRPSRHVVRVMGDPTVPRRIGEWLAQRSGLPLQDRTTNEELDAKTEELRKKLAESGKFGQWAAKMIPPPRRNP